MQPDYHQREVPAIHFPRLHFHITTRPGSAVMMSPGKQEEGDVEKGGDVERKGGERGRKKGHREEVLGGNGWILGTKETHTLVTLSACVQPC